MKAASGTLLVLLNARLLQQVECSMWSGHWLGKEFQHPGDREGFITHDKVSVTLIGDTGFYTIPAWDGARTIRIQSQSETHLYGTMSGANNEHFNCHCTLLQDASIFCSFGEYTFSGVKTHAITETLASPDASSSRPAPSNPHDIYDACRDSCRAATERVLQDFVREL
ncbi:unnamed protein product [Symbiodinium natans]|uniref:Uncharacterized protein n=1 Tax=Symbiodinium natans TaxID=878477 RepID=A0A812QU85_9DINO|nr:unnamed protein product [Symbiodinium natans]